jgi:hypothetical protein
MFDATISYKGDFYRMEVDIVDNPSQTYLKSMIHLLLTTTMMMMMMMKMMKKMMIMMKMMKMIIQKILKRGIF